MKTKHCCYKEISPLVKTILDVKFNLNVSENMFSLQDNFSETLINIEKKFWLNNFSVKQVNLLKYAFIVTLDEMVLISNKELATVWQPSSLQLKYFAANNGGEQFYTNLEELCNNIENNKYILEVYYICLSLGFFGKYRFQNLTARELIILNLKDKLFSPQYSHKNLPVSVVMSKNTKSWQQNGFNVWRLALGCFVIAAACFAINLNLSINLKWLYSPEQSFSTIKQ